MDQKTMLFRCNQTLFGLLALSSLCALKLTADQQSFKKEGTQFGKEAHAKGLNFDDSVLSGLTPADQKGQVFDASLAKEKIKKNDKSLPSNEAYDLLQDPSVYKYQELKPDKESIQHADAIIERYQRGVIEQNDTKDKYKIEKCLQVDAPFQIDLQYSLTVNVTPLQETKKAQHICKGHEKQSFCFFNSVKHTIKKKIKKLASDPTVKSYQVEDDGSGFVRSIWTHHDNAPGCDNHQIKQQFETKDTWRVNDSSNEKLAKSPNCTFLRSNRFESGTKIIEGVEISRDNWKKVDTYMCRHESTKCPFFGSFHCTQISKQCKQKSGEKCALWEITFRCLTEKSNKITLKTEELFGADEQLWETSYSPNTSFSEAVTKLKIFDEMKKEFEASSQSDISRIQLFSGKKSQCSKSIASDLMYDCCFAYKGLTNDLKLSKCTSDEIALAEKREKGLCYYVGSYKEKMLKLWTSRKEHVYCCFPTKLARVLQQEGRKQLEIDWGSPKKPVCRGLTQEEIQRLDLSKLDLSEAYEAPPSVDMTKKIQILETRLKKRLAEYQEEK